MSSKQTSSQEEADNVEKSNAQELKLNEYIRQLLAEKSLIDEKQCPYAYKYIDEEISRAQQKLIKGPLRNDKYIDVYHEKSLKISVKVLVPVKEHPRYNFIGKLLGPKGNTLKQLQENTMCYMNICGRGSMKDREKEEELRQSLEPKYAHLSDNLHVEISTIAAPAAAYSRISFALTEVRRYLIPEYNTLFQEERILFSKKPGLGKVNVDEKEQEINPIKEEYSASQKALSFRPMLRSPITSKSSVMSILNKAGIALQESYAHAERHGTNLSDYEDYDNINYHPKPKKRYFEENRSFGRYM